MSSRRNFFKTASLSAIAATSLSSVNSDYSYADMPKFSPKLPSADDPKFWEKIRKMFPMPLDETYFNTGTIGAVPNFVMDRVNWHMRASIENISNPTAPKIMGGYDGEDGVREKIAKLINADMKEIALTRNSTMGTSFIACGLDLKEGDEVVLTDQEHPGGRCAWELLAKRKGIVLKYVKMDVPANDPDVIVERFVNEITPRTKAFSFSHLISIWSTMLPVKAICAEARKRGIISVVDGAQGIGQVPVDVKDIDCDVYISSLHKWILAPAGNGMIYINKNLSHDVWSVVVGHMWDYHEDDGMRITVRGTENPALLAGLDSALDLHYAIGPKKVTDRILFMSNRLREGLQKIDKIQINSSTREGMCAGMTTFNIKGMKGSLLEKELWEKGKIRPTTKGDDVGIRISTQIYNSPDDVDRTIDIISSLAKKS